MSCMEGFGTKIKIPKKDKMKVMIFGYKCFLGIYKVWHPLSPDDPEIPTVVHDKCKEYSNYLREKYVH